MVKSRENVKRTSKISAVVVVDHTNKIFLSRLIFFSPQLSKFVFSVLCKKEVSISFRRDNKRERIDTGGPRYSRFLTIRGPENRGKPQKKSTVLALFEPKMWVFVFVNHNFKKRRDLVNWQEKPVV